VCKSTRECLCKDCFISTMVARPLDTDWQEVIRTVLKGCFDASEEEVEEVISLVKIVGTPIDKGRNLIEV